MDKHTLAYFNDTRIECLKRNFPAAREKLSIIAGIEPTAARYEPAPATKHEERHRHPGLGENPEGTRPGGQEQSRQSCTGGNQPKRSGLPLSLG